MAKPRNPPELGKTPGKSRRPNRRGIRMTQYIVSDLLDMYFCMTSAISKQVASQSAPVLLLFRILRLKNDLIKDLAKRFANLRDHILL